MKPILFLLILISLADVLSAQYVYTIKADSVKLTNCDSSELIIENHTQNVPGFLFNTGNGRTVFKRGVLKLNDSFYLIGGDTLKYNAWVQGGNRFGTTGLLGTLDNNHLDFYTNNTQRARLMNTGNLIVGSTADEGYKLQVMGTGGIYINPRLSLPGDRICFGGNLNTGDGQESIISGSSDSGRTFYSILLANKGNIGLGTGAAQGWYVGHPTLRINAGNGYVSIGSQSFFFGSPGGPYNCSSLVSYVSNTNEWNTGLGNYPSGQNFYYFGTLLATPEAGNKRAPLRIGADELHFRTGPVNGPTFDLEAGMFSESGNLLLGSTVDNGKGKLQVKGNITGTDSLCLGISIPTAQLHTTGSVRFAGLISDTTKTRVLVSDVNGNLYYRDASTLAINGILNSSLAVNGTISAQRLKLSQAGWPDYVFDSSYRLPSLKELEGYIQKNKHLPGMPSAAEVERMGIDVGDHQAALLKKVEELTLYNIKQEEELKAQSKKLGVQTDELSTLKKEMVELRKLIENKAGK